jgi:hypothetical protein
MMGKIAEIVTGMMRAMRPAPRDWKHDERLRPLWRLVAWPVGLYFATWYWLPRYTSRITVRGAAASHAGPAVYVHWHRHLPFLLGHNGERRRWLLISPAPYMETVLRGCRLFGLRMVRGTSGHGGQAALAQLQDVLARGESVIFAVDGPAGPPFEVKRGCVDLARAAGVPIVPMSFHSRHAREDTARWDRMLRPRLFDDITVVYGEPIAVSDGNVAGAQRRIAAALNALDPALAREP